MVERGGDLQYRAIIMVQYDVKKTYEIVCWFLFRVTSLKKNCLFSFHLLPFFLCIYLRGSYGYFFVATNEWEKKPVLVSIQSAGFQLLNDEKTQSLLFELVMMIE